MPPRAALIKRANDAKAMQRQFSLGLEMFPSATLMVMQRTSDATFTMDRR